MRARVIPGSALNPQLEVIHDAEPCTMGTPWGLWLRSDGVMLVCDGNRGRITLMDLNGNVLSYFGRGGRAPGQFTEAHMLCVGSDGTLYEADSSGKRVQKFVSTS